MRREQHHSRVDGVNQAFKTLAFNESALLPEGDLYMICGRAYAGPLTYLSVVKMEGRYPLLSRYAPGMIERDRDRRRHR